MRSLVRFQGIMTAAVLIAFLVSFGQAPSTCLAQEKKAKQEAKAKDEPKEEPAETKKEEAAASRLRIAFIVAHPGDAELGCGGLIAQLAKGGHEVIVACASTHRGDRLEGQELEDDVRKRESAASAAVLGVEQQPEHFLGFAHEKLFADELSLGTISQWLDKHRPNIVVTHWPLDNHENHHVISSLVWQNYRRPSGWNLYFFETMTGRQTLDFPANLYLDITKDVQQKQRAVECHKSQKPAELWKVHDALQRQRGQESGVQAAEAYHLVEVKQTAPVLPVPLIKR